MNGTPSYLKSLKKESVVQSVINCLTDAMRSKELRPGDQIPPEPELAASLGVARSSVREAIKILTYLGVLESKRSEGTFVCNGFQESMIDPMVYGIILNQDSSANLMELREITESGIMRLAMEKHTAEEMEQLHRLLERMGEALESGEDTVDRFFHADNDFHDMVSQMGKNPLADKIGRVVRTLTYAMRYETVSAMIRSGRGEELLEAHRKLCRALEEQREDGVDRLVRDTYFVEVLEGDK
jgi:DNA-binding FadR family transcriptional regulator